MPLPWKEALSVLPRPNFIAIHYVYIFGCIIVGSVILYGAKNISYIDALLFCSGSSTQSGLNPVDLKDLMLYQQIVLFLIPFITNPIWIHSIVVFVRLHWFRLRFEDIVAESRMRRGRTTSTQKSDADQEEGGVRGRPITVLHRPPEDIFGPRTVNGGRSLPPYNTTPTGTPFDRSANASSDSIAPSEKSDEHPVQTEKPENANGNDSMSIQFNDRPHPKHVQSEGPHITFADPSKKQPSRFLRARKHSDTLRIPSPREYERGGMPTAIEDDEEEYELRRVKTASAVQGAPLRPVTSLPSDGMTGSLGDTRAKTIERSNDIPQSRLRGRRNSANSGFIDRFPRSITLENAINKIKGKRDGSPASRFTALFEQEPKPYLSWTPTIARNSQFVDLTDEQRNELGGVEYRSLKLLSKILCWYFFFFHAVGFIAFLGFIMASKRHKQIVNDAHIGAPWWALFTSASSFHDLGFSLTANSMISFQDAEYILLWGSFLIIIGNTAFPCLLRFIIWLLFKIVPSETQMRESLHFLLDHPRRCFTLLFPSKPTWALFAIVVILNVVDTILFIILDFNNPEVTVMSVWDRLVAGLFQAASTRTAGFSVVNLANLHPAVQVSYLVMMYISVFPIAISVRRTNVYEERSLGIYSTDPEDEDVDATKEPSYIGAHLRKQLSFDLWYIVLGVFIICIAEGGKLADVENVSFNVFAILFEVVSAYGTVGMSLGYPGTDTSLCAQFSVISKLVIIAMQIRGRHRGLPYALDRAVLLPSKTLHEKEEADAKRRLQRRLSNLSQFTAERNRMLEAVSTQERHRILNSPSMENAITFGSTTGATIPNNTRMTTSI